MSPFGDVVLDVFTGVLGLYCCWFLVVCLSVWVYVGCFVCVVFIDALGF